MWMHAPRRATEESHTQFGRTSNDDLFNQTRHIRCACYKLRFDKIGIAIMHPCNLDCDANFFTHDRTSILNYNCVMNAARRRTAM